MGVIAAIAIPRLSRVTKTSKEKAFKLNLAKLRQAVELYAAEHEGKYPPTSSLNGSLARYTNLTGDLTAENKDVAQGIIYGPYIDKLPPMPLGNKANPKGFTRVNDPAAKPPNTSNLVPGWWYNAATGDVRANLPDSEVDEDGVPYNTY